MMSNSDLPADAIIRNPDQFSKESFDLIVVGAGIYGCCLALEAARRNLKCLLIERNDYGSQTSNNHLRIVHGGLRYLQKLDFKRFFDSVQERSWFLTNFPDFVSPLDCMMPLYNEGLKRASVFRLALMINDVMSWRINQSIPLEQRLKRGRVIENAEVIKHFPEVGVEGLSGAAIWQDGYMIQPQRLPIEILRWAALYGGKSLNYIDVEEVLIEGDQVQGVRGVDAVTGKSFEFHSQVVVNATGPWCRQFSKTADRDYPQLFPNRILVWNLLFNRPAHSNHAVAISEKINHQHTYFVVPYAKKILAGTGHVVLDNNEMDRLPSHAEIRNMIDEINSGVPKLDLSVNDVKRVMWGIMPGSSDGTLGSREVIVEHGNYEGPKGLYTVSGVKFTTARLVADKFLSEKYPDLSVKNYGDGFSNINNQRSRVNSLSSDKIDNFLSKLSEEESVVELEDLLFRRINLFDDAELSEIDYVAKYSDKLNFDKGSDYAS